MIAPAGSLEFVLPNESVIDCLFLTYETAGRFGTHSGISSKHCAYPWVVAVVYPSDYLSATICSHPSRTSWNNWKGGCFVSFTSIFVWRCCGQTQFIVTVQSRHLSDWVLTWLRLPVSLAFSVTFRNFCFSTSCTIKLIEIFDEAR